MDQSLAARVQRRSDELLSDKPIVLDIPGYEGVLVAQYHPLGYKTINRIAKKHQRLPEADMNLYASADYLINACDDILEVRDDGNVSTGLTWGPEIAQEVWGKPGIATARQALLAIFPPPRDMDLISHANDLLTASREANSETDEELVGESAAGSAAA